ncbi:TetR/AcrR family transcriptional regulator [Jatrophihabitans sp. YIM 134969]
MTAASASAPARRRGRPGHDLDSVRAAAVALFIEQGFDGTSIDDLARRLGISKSAVYHHITGKDALLADVLDRALTGIEQVVAEVRALDGPAVDRLVALVRGSVVVLVERLPYVTVLLRVRGNSDVERDALTRRRRLDRLAADLVRQAIADGDLRPDVDPAVTARLLFGTVNSLTEWLKPGVDHDADALATALVTTVFDGLRA